jgi:hypothetical protein
MALEPTAHNTSAPASKACQPDNTVPLDTNEFMIATRHHLIPY